MSSQHRAGDSVAGVTGKPELTKNTLKLSRWDAADELKTDQDCALYLQAIIEVPGADEKQIAAAVGDIARAHGMMQVAHESDRAREAPYRSLSAEGDQALPRSRSPRLKLKVGVA